MNLTMISGLLAIICAMTFFTRWATGGPEAVAWPRTCLLTRAFLFGMGAIFMVRGVSLITGSCKIGPGGELFLVLFTGYSVAMLVREIKAMPPRDHGAPRSTKPPSCA